MNHELNNLYLKYATHGVRSVMGLIFVVFGLNFFFHFIPMPEGTAEGNAFTGALFQSGYIFPVLKTFEISMGLLLLINILVPFALVVIFPVVLNIFLFHLFLDTSGLPMGIFLLAANLFLAFIYCKSYKDIFHLKHQL